MAWKSVLKPEGSITAGIATLGLVYGIYQLNVGSSSQAQATDANHPALNTTKKRAGYTALVVVAGLSLITRDANIAILGGSGIIAMELSYRHAIMADPKSGKMQNPSPSTSYQPAQNAYSAAEQGATG